MKQLYIIILDPFSDTSVIKNRISESGNYYVVYENQYLLISDQSSAKSLYESLTRNIPDASIGVVILGVSLSDLTYWGYSSKGLWSWLKESIAEAF